MSTTGVRSPPGSSAESAQPAEHASQPTSLAARRWSDDLHERRAKIKLGGGEEKIASAARHRRS